MNTGPISNPSLHIKPSQTLRNYLSNVKVVSDLPPGIANFVYKNKVANPPRKPSEPKYLLTDQDRHFIKTLKLDSNMDFTNLPLESEQAHVGRDEHLLNLQDLHWLYNYLQEVNQGGANKVYLHELLEGSQMILPKNQEVPRNPELEKRCARLRASQQNREYSNMTKNVDNMRRKHPEDTISYQMKEMNRHLIAIFQFIVSVLAGFAFGFIGVELLIGSLDFGFRLLLGIICALTIALAELYFLAKRLNEDLRFETEADAKAKGLKLD